VAEGAAAWRERARARRTLGRLNDRMLHDLGIDRTDVVDDRTGQFWRLR
jgi:uncharacterized protein YjiS (DUF1127 family)